MLNEQQAAEMEALRAERAELERIIGAPKRLGEVAGRMMQLEKAGQRAEARALADSIAPGWRERLAAAEAELAAATTESDRLFQAAAAREQVSVLGAGIEYPAGTLPGRLGEVSPGLAGMVPEIARDPVRGMAEMKRSAAVRRVQSLRTYPARLAAQKAAPPVVPDPAEEAPTRRVRFGR